MEQGMTQEQAEAKLARLPPTRMPVSKIINPEFILSLIDLFEKAGMSPAAAHAAAAKVQRMLPPPTFPYPSRDSTGSKEVAEFRAFAAQLKVGLWCLTGVMLPTSIIRLSRW
jgi:hypothetical protein